MLQNSPKSTVVGEVQGPNDKVGQMKVSMLSQQSLDAGQERSLPL